MLSAGSDVTPAPSDDVAVAELIGAAERDGFTFFDMDGGLFVMPSPWGRPDLAAAIAARHDEIRTELGRSRLTDVVAERWCALRSARRTPMT